MKIEVIEKLISSEDNVSGIKDVIKKYDELDDRIKTKLEETNFNKGVLFIATDYSVVKNRSIKEIIELLDIFIKSNYDSNLYLLIIKDKLLSFSFDEQKKILDIYNKSENKKNIFQILNSDFVLNKLDSKQTMIIINRILGISNSKLINTIEYMFRKNNLNSSRSFEEKIVLIDKLIENIENIEKINSVIFSDKVLKYRTHNEQLQLINKLKEKSFKEDVLCLCINNDVLKYRTLDEQLVLIETLEKCEYNKNVLEFILVEVSDLTFKDQIELIEIFRLYNYDSGIYIILFSKNIIMHNTIEEIESLINIYMSSNEKDSIFEIIDNKEINEKFNIYDRFGLINLYVKSDYNDNVFDIITNINVLNNRSVYEIDEMIKILENRNYDYDVYKSLLNPELLLLPFEKQKSIINSNESSSHIPTVKIESEMTNFEEQLNRIHDLKNLKLYISALKSKEYKDIKLDTKVPRYVFEKK